MTPAEQISLINKLRQESSENEWVEFKSNYVSPQDLGEYLSALANSACLLNKSKGYIFFGIHDTTHEVVGTTYNPRTQKAKGNSDLLIWLSLGLKPHSFEYDIVNHPDGTVVYFEVNPALGEPVNFYGAPYIRIGSSKTALANFPDKQRAIWLSRTSDWSGLICSGASLEDIDRTALSKAREQFVIKNPRQAAECKSWDDITFLNKAKLAIHGEITNSAIILLGIPESATLLSPMVARISWILKDGENRELDYTHFGPPFILNVDQLLGKIRNLTLRTLPSGTLFPQEISQYDPWVLREALHNCIAHQDYRLQGRIEVVETPHSITLVNSGNFLPGNVEDVIRRDAPLETYRNPFLAEAMVNLNMIDTQGGGIKKMFQTQINRYFPLPDYDLSNSNRVIVKIPGLILDEHYTRLLMSKTRLNIEQVFLLDKVQKKENIPFEARKLLRSLGLIEGRAPNIIISSPVAEITGQKARHIRQRGFDDQYYMDLIIALLSEHGPVDRQEIDKLLLDKLPDIMNTQRKRSKIHNLLSQLVRRKQIANVGSRGHPEWVFLDDIE